MKIINFCLLIILTTGTHILNAQKTEDPVFITIGDHEITLSEFESIYRKNNANPNIQQQSVDEYLDLFINYKLKVIEAMNRGLDTTQSFESEYRMYRKQLMEPYSIDNKIIDDMVKKIYERMKTEVNVSHIIIANKENEDDDSTDAVAILQKARERILNGEEFSKVAREISEDPSAAHNGGNLGYFTALRYIPPFENVCYNLEPGEVSEPFQTRFGHHIVKLHDTRPSRGQVKVAHIMLMTPEGMSEEQEEEVQERIRRLYDSLKQGSDFAELARRHSEDRASAVDGGELNWFGSGRMVPEFEKAAFDLENQGDLSEPMKTGFGWHIIKLIDKRELGSFEEEKEDIRNRMNRLGYFRNVNQLGIEELKKKYDLEVKPENLEVFYTKMDSSFFDQQWKIDEPEKLDEVLMTLDGKAHLQKEFYAYLKDKQNLRYRQGLENIVNNEFNNYIKESLRELEMRTVEKENPGLAHLLEEYHDGILLFELTDQMVWTRAIEDTAGLEAFYEAREDDYQWNTRWESTVFTCPDVQKAVELKEELKPRKKDTEYYQELIERICAADTGCITFRTGKYEKGDRSWIDQAWGKKGVYLIQPGNDKNTDIRVVVMHKKLKPTQKELEEARGLVTADYQSYLEKKWIAELRNKYEISVNDEILERIE